MVAGPQRGRSAESAGSAAAAVALGSNPIARAAVGAVLVGAVVLVVLVVRRPF